MGRIYKNGECIYQMEFHALFKDIEKNLFKRSRIPAVPYVKDAVLAGKCNYSCICNTVSAYHKDTLQSPAPQNTHKDDDTKYSLRNLLRRQET